jgi:selenocysteine lyase/cysteine desulfurase
MGCDVGEVAITGNTTDGLNVACSLLNADAVALEDEFSSAPIAWMQARHTVHFVTATEVEAHCGDILGALESKLRTTPAAKVLLLSSVSYMDGHRIDIQRAGEMCERCGVDLVVDGSQSLGAEPLNLSSCKVAFFCAASYKWLCAGPGLGILYASSSVLQRMEPGAAPAAGWFGQAIDGRNFELNPHVDAQRFHYGTPNLTILAALCASLQLIDEVGGTSAIAARNLELSTYLRDSLQSRGFELIGAFGVPTTAGTPGADQQSSHITGVAIAFCDDPKVVASQLQTQHRVSVTAKDRHGVRGLRVACHIYNTVEDIDTFVRSLAEVRDAMTECKHNL